MPRPLLVATTLVLGVVLAACGGPPAPAEEGERPLVLASTSIVGDLAREVLAPDDGDALADIEVLMPTGVDPHAFEPSAADALALRQADLVVVVGLGLEEALLDAISAAEADGITVVELGPAATPRPFTGGADAHEDGGDGDHEDGGDGDHEDGDDDHEDDDDDHDDDHEGGLDPHVWLDPVRVVDMLDELAGAFADLEPDAAEVLAERMVGLRAEWEALDAELAAVLEDVPDDRRSFVTDHDAFGYLASRYDLEVAGVIREPGGGSARTGAYLELVELIRDQRVPAVFADAEGSGETARALAGEVDGVAFGTLRAGSLTDADGPAPTLRALLRLNVDRLAEALR